MGWQDGILHAGRPCLPHTQRACRVPWGCRRVRGVRDVLHNACTCLALALHRAVHSGHQSACPIPAQSPLHVRSVPALSSKKQQHVGRRQPSCLLLQVEHGDVAKHDHREFKLRALTSAGVHPVAGCYRSRLLFGCGSVFSAACCCPPIPTASF